MMFQKLIIDRLSCGRPFDKSNAFWICYVYYIASIYRSILKEKFKVGDIFSAAL